MAEETTSTQTETSTTQTTGEPVFTQADIDRVVSARLAKEKAIWERTTGATGKEKAELEDLRKKQAEQDRIAAEKAGDWARLEKSLREDYDGKITERDGKLTRAEQELRTERIRGAIIAAAAKRIAHNPEEIADILEKRARLDDEYRTEVLDRDGKRMYAPGGKDMTIDLLVEQYLHDNPHQVRSTQASGGGGSRGGASTSSDGSALASGVHPKVREAEQKVKEAEAKAQTGDNAALAGLLKARRELDAAKKEVTH